MRSNRISLQLSKAARDALRQHISRIEYDDPITTVVWSEAGYAIEVDGSTRKCEPEWGVGWYKPEKVPLDMLQIIDGLKFVFDQDKKSDELSGALLDFKGGRFIVCLNESAASNKPMEPTR